MRSETLLKTLALVGAGLLTVACGDDDDGGEVPTDAGTDAGGTDGGQPMDGGVDGGPEPMDGNDDFEDAIVLARGVTRSDTIDFSGDADWFTFTANAGEWVLARVSNTTAESAEQPLPDPAVIIYDGEELVFAANTDQVAGGTAGELLMRMPETGTWYLLVSQENASVGTYDVFVQSASPRPGILEDAETGDDAASAVDNDLGSEFQGPPLGDFIIGTFDRASDVDVFRFTITGDEPASAAAGFHVGGRSVRNEENSITLASGSTASPARTWITTVADPDTIIARFDEDLYTNGAPLGRTVQPSLGAGEYLLWVASDGEPVGANPFYFGRIRTGGENPLEMMDEQNDEPSTPEAIAQATGTGINNGFILATLGDGDVDHFSVVATGTMQPYAVCGSRASGSGVLGLELSLLASNGAVLNACGEDNDEPCTLTENLANGPGNLVLIAGNQPPGTYLVRLRKSGQDDEVTGNWVRCGLGTVTP